MNLNKYALTENFVINNRTKLYSNQNGIEKYFINLSNQYFKAIGKNLGAKATTPIVPAISGLFILKNFLDSVFASAVFLLILLSILLIYSLMISNLEEKNYEYAMLRVLGFYKKNLVLLLLFQSMFFSLPGLFLGLIFSYIVNAFISFKIFDFTQEFTNFQLHWSALIIAITLGILMPIISNIIPISRSLSKNLKDSLDLYHRVVNETTVQVVKLEKLGISLSQFVISITLIFIGILTYYLAPSAFIYQNIPLFLAVMNIILILMIIGFTLLASFFQTSIEFLWIKFLLIIFWKDKILDCIIFKNMKAHQRRNKKTSIMFSIAMSFLIFAGTGLKLQISGIENSIRMNLGADLTINTHSLEVKGLKEYQIRNFLENYKQNNPGHIANYSFNSFPIDKIPKIPWPKLGPLSGFPISLTGVKAVDPEFAYTILDKFYMPKEYDNSINYENLPGTSKKNGFQSN